MAAATHHDVMSMSDEGGAPPKRPRTQGGEEMTPSDSKSSIAEGMAQLEERIASLHSHIQQATREAADVQELFNKTVAAQTPFLAQKWPGVLSALSSAVEGLRGIGEGVKGTCRPIGWAKPPPPRHLGDDLSADVWRGVIHPMLSVSEAVCSARPTSKAHGSQLVDEAFMLKRIDQDLNKDSLTGLVDVERPTPPTGTPTAADTDPPGGPPTHPQPDSDAATPADRSRRFRYLSASAYALERGGAVLQQMADFIHLSHKYKLTKELPLRLSADGMADDLANKTALDELPLALAVYKTFGHLLTYKPEGSDEETSLALERVEGGDDGDQSESGQDSEDGMDEGGNEEQDDDIDQQGQENGGGDVSAGEGPGGSQQGGQPGGVRRQRYRIGEEDFTTVHLADLPPTHPYRSTYDVDDPVVRHDDCLYPSFTTFLKATVLMRWYGQEGVEEEELTDAHVGRDDTGYQFLLTAPAIEGYKTVDYIDEHPVHQGYDGRRLIILKGTVATDTIAAYLLVVSGSIRLYTTEAPSDGSTDIDRYPIAVAAARPLLAKYGLEMTVLA
ncbi:unnamed protein product [Vitrella brassicaformis CCMP3155]|uniref:Uncharacterized protein n=1 Tax=Vitrella brassicaformis (strain CCMP3155) TaxID=1169540 RepID=A0A0G4E9S4_VITBC|nr:unnamed protein product [Vitrella brassicaformis CCMP3155]|eukprot:CEL92189.1 unnamed protein product [Vitrella brassicaformis CCMP3155]